MASVGSVGSTSLDINSIVSQLMTIESRRKTLLQQDEAGFQVKLTAVGTLSSALSSFKSAMDSLRSASSFQSLKATPGDSTVFTATASTSATPGTYNLQVTQLAKANMLASSAYVDTSTAIATGTLTIQVGTGAATDITIDATNNTLAGIRDAINNSDAEVTASIINDGTGYKLIMTADKMGTSNTIKVTVTGDSVGTDTDTDGLSNLMYDPTGTKNMTEIQTAQPATMKMGTLTINKDSNTVTDAIPGVTLNLLKEGTTSLTVSNDTSVVSTNVNKFVTEYNSFVSLISQMADYNPTTKQSGIMSGDTSIVSLRSQARSIISAAIPGATGALTSLASIGITTQSDGTLTVDSTKLNSALSSNYSDVVKLFAKMGTTTDANVSYKSSTTATTAGTYDINITQAATKGNIVGGGAVGSLTIDGTNNTLNLSINGVAGTITIASATYASGADLAAEIQSKINGLSAFSSAGITAAASYDAGTGKLTITSNTYGSTSSVGTISGNAAANLALDTGVSTGGLNVAGSIGGHGATGSGQTLTGNAGTAVEGLAITVMGTGTGARGSVTYSVGTAESLYSKVNSWLDSTNGIITTKTDNINASIKRVQKSISDEDVRLSAKRESLVRQYSTLQTLLDQLNSVSNFLANQSVGFDKLIKG